MRRAMEQVRFVSPCAPGSQCGAAALEVKATLIKNKLGLRLHHHAERHCRGLEVVLARNQLIEREAHVARARVPVVLHDEARGGGRRHLPEVGARQPG